MGRVLHVPGSLRRGRRADEQAAVESAVASIAYLCAHFGLPDLGATRVLDVGCGTKFTQAFLEHDLPVGHYVGVDVYAPMIDYLRAEVDDPRFEFHHMDTYNERYNPTGEPLGEDTRLPLDEGRRFDLVVLFSVFTHLEPRDYRLMLRMLRRYVEPAGHLFFTLYLDETTPGGKGLMDGFARSGGAAYVGGTRTFRDLKPDSPLEWALYSRDHAFELIEGTGWEVERLDDPTDDIQHHVTCRPV
jgi:SAM-dependent methyltransferase